MTAGIRRAADARVRRGLEGVPGVPVESRLSATCSARRLDDVLAQRDAALLYLAELGHDAVADEPEQVPGGGWRLVVRWCPDGGLA